MARRRTRTTTLLAVAATAALAAATAQAATAQAATAQAATAQAATAQRAVPRSGAWSQVTPPGTSIIKDLGLVRGSDGVLHVLWTTGSAPHVELKDTPVGAGGAVHPAVTLTSGWDIITDPDAVAAGDSLHAIWGGVKTDTGPQGLFQSTRPRSGGGWAPFQNSVADTGGAEESLSVGATATRTGQIFAAIARTDVLAISALPRQFVQIPPTTCCVDHPGLASDSATGATWVAYLSLVTHHEGIFAQRLTATGHASGAARRLPGSGSGNGQNVLTVNQRIGITSRGGNRSGVFAAYGSGYPVLHRVDLLRMGASRPRVIASTGRDIGAIAVAADPSGRLWVAWVVKGASSSSRPLLFVRRSNLNLTSFGPTEQVALPPGTDQVWKFSMSAQASRLQLVALTSKSITGKAAYWTRTAPPPR